MFANTLVSYVMFNIHTISLTKFCFGVYLRVNLVFIHIDHRSFTRWVA